MVLGLKQMNFIINNLKSKHMKEILKLINQRFKSMKETLIIVGDPKSHSWSSKVLISKDKMMSLDIGYMILMN